MSEGCVLGIDTSNYTSSVSIVSRDEDILFDGRRLLDVKKGERGIRQQEAVFQHVKNLPELVREAFEKFDGEISGVSVSVRPRPVEGSYMPCFLAGRAVGSGIADATGVPLMEFSHQEGHIAAVAPKGLERFLSWHLSGGTCELLAVERGEIEIIGGSRDISFGQILDRTGIAMGLDFPAGAALDELAGNGKSCGVLKKIKNDSFNFNVSGTETQVMKNIGKMRDEDIAFEIFSVMSDLLARVTEDACRARGIKDTVFVGGVALSKVLRGMLSERLKNIHFGAISSDNAVGVAILGMRKLWSSENR